MVGSLANIVFFVCFTPIATAATLPQWLLFNYSQRGNSATVALGRGRMQFFVCVSDSQRV